MVKMGKNTALNKKKCVNAAGTKKCRYKMRYSAQTIYVKN